MYGIQRVEKYKRADVVGLQKEANRQMKQSEYINDVNLANSKQNIWFARSTNWLHTIDAELKKAGIAKPRKDAVLMVGSFYGASPEFFNGMTKEDIIKYFKDCYNWHLKTYCHNDPALVINAVIHFDETTPHMQVESVPLTNDGRLSAKQILGNIKAYTARVDSFYDDVSKAHGLERGEPQTDMARAEHKTALEHKIQKYKEQILQLQKQVQSAIKSEQDALIKGADLVSDNETLKLEIQQLRKEHHKMYDQNKDLKEQFTDLEQRYHDLEKSIANKQKALEALNNAFLSKQEEYNSLDVPEILTEIEDLKAGNDWLNAVLERMIKDEYVNFKYEQAAQIIDDMNNYTDPCLIAKQQIIQHDDLEL